MILSARIPALSALIVLNLCLRTSYARLLPTNNSILKKDYTPAKVLPQCQIYCNGPLLHTVQMAQLFEDSKTFVDMKLKLLPAQTLENFEAFMASKGNNPTKDELRQFVTEHFDDVGKEFMTWDPSDWVENPKFLDGIVDPDLKQWASDLNEIWKELGRKMIDDVYTNSEYYSIIPVPNPVIVPGGRFREFYYWDSYWIIRGLLYSEMTHTAKGMLENFMSIVERFGYIPNGGRVYYQRSQPPLLAGMIHSYLEFTGDTEFAMKALPTLEHEFEYWMNNHTVQAKGYNLWLYRDSSTGPRPESYREDVITSQDFPTDAAKEEHYSELKAGAESGMDFSSRWFINAQGTSEGNLTNLKTSSIVPVELNAILHWNAKIISEFYALAGNATKSKEFAQKADSILEAIEAVLWNEEAGVWLDYDLINSKPRDYFVPTNLSPLWTKAYDIQKTAKISESVMKYIEKHGLDNYPGGVPNTLYNTGEQWDFPNVWPPMQSILIKGLQNLNTTESKDLAERWANRWVKSNFAAYKDTRAMFEKYNAEQFGGHGGGGEYEIQKGFGWSNGVIIELLADYGNRITLAATPGGDGGADGGKAGVIYLVALAFVGVLFLTR